VVDLGEEGGEVVDPVEGEGREDGGEELRCEGQGMVDGGEGDTGMRREEGVEGVGGVAVEERGGGVGGGKVREAGGRGDWGQGLGGGRGDGKRASNVAGVGAEIEDRREMPIYILREKD